ncbi:MAG: Rrf2 family transcriptional regulator [Ignavibacteria bacterium]|jgi:Rrf2 family iron-sulfur cluster assembly transcriptional regulator|nr:Rrf2 family transcriptional regulator [Ignavibacteria bacterium]
MFSKACEYGIRASIFIAIKSRSDIRVSLNDIARETDSPVSFTAKILQTLVKNKIIDSLKGPNGGFEIKKSKAGKIRLSQVVKAIDGDSIYKKCGLGFRNCDNKKPCPLHYKFTIVREDLRKMLEETTLLELSEDIENGQTFLKRN